MSERKRSDGSPELPLGFGIALAHDMRAMDYFAGLSPEQKKRVIDHTHQIQSKEQMRAYVHELGEHGLT